MLFIGIQVQTSRIPLRFLIKQLHNGFQIVCAGNVACVIVLFDIHTFTCSEQVSHLVAY